MWNSAQAADTQMAWQQVAAWQRTYDLLLHHEGRLKACRDELTYAWPPDRSPAATAFVEYIDGLLISIGRAKQDAVENHRALALVLTSLSATKSDMAKLKAEWEQHEAEDATMAKNLPNDLFASGENWQETLNEKARVRMAQNDQEVFEAKQQMVVPTTQNRIILDDAKPFPDGKGGPGVSGNSTNGNMSISAGSGNQWMKPTVVQSVPDLDSVSLAGNQAVALRPEVPAAPANSVSTAGGIGPVPGPPVLPLSRQQTPGRAATPPFARGAVQAAREGRNIGGIGGAHAVGSVGGVRPSQSWEPNRQLGRRINPVGGVIGEGHTGPGSAFPLGGSVGGSARSNGDNREVPRTLQWTSQVGVEPVIEPPLELPYELGPGVFGIDR
jgi:hypothetical protein